MTDELATIYIDGNSEALIEEIKICLQQKKLRVERKENENCDYVLQILDLDKSTDEEHELSESLNKSNGTLQRKTCLLISLSSHTDKSKIENIKIQTQKLLSSKNLNLRVIYAYDLYLTTNSNPGSVFQNWVSNAWQKEAISVSEKGNLKYYPLAIKDVCNLVLKSLFISNTSGMEFIAAGEELSDLEIAYLLKKTLEKKGRKLDINLNGQPETTIGNLTNSTIETQALLNWTPEENFLQNIDTIFENRQIPKEEIQFQHQNKLKKLEIKIEKKSNGLKTRLFQKREIDRQPTAKKTKFSILYISLGVIGMIITIPFFTSFASVYMSTKLTAKAFQEIRNGNSERSQNTLKKGQLYQRLGESSFHSIQNLSNLLSRKETASINNYLLILDNGQKLVSLLISTYDLGNKLYLGLLGKENIEIKTLTSAIRVNLITITEKLSQIQLSEEQLKTNYNFLKNVDLTQLNQQISLLKSQISDAIPLLDIIEKIGSVQGVQRYLVIIQDNNELRPTGGFISSYGLITLDQGKLIDFQIDSTLSINRLIDEQVIPPTIIKQLLGQSNWNFHDSNIDADFAISAAQMAWFYQKYRSVNIDGAIGLNLTYLYYLLDQTGPMVLADGQNVSQNNLFALASNPTSSKGLDVVTSLTQVLTKKLLAGEIKFADFSRSLLKTTTFHEINAWFVNQKLESLAIESKISGVVKEEECHPQLLSLGCKADTIYLNESNMSLNKLNYYLRRNQNLTAKIDGLGKVNYTLDYDYQYPVSVPLNIIGSYKAYYQLYLPKNTSDITIAMDGELIPANLQIINTMPTLLKIEFSANLTVNQNHQLEIKFTSPNSLDLKKQLMPYTLALLKQPGIMNDNLMLKIIFPENFTPLKMTVPLKQTSSQELIFQTNKVSQENIGVVFKNQAL